MLTGPEERVCLDTRCHGIVLAAPLARASLLAGAGAFLLVQPWPAPIAGAVLLGFAALIALASVWRWERTRLVVTTEKLCVVRGTLRRRAAAVRFSRIGAIGLEQTLGGRLFGYGTLFAGELEIQGVADPRAVCGLVTQLCE